MSPQGQAMNPSEVPWSRHLKRSKTASFRAQYLLPTSGVRIASLTWTTTVWATLQPGRCCVVARLLLIPAGIQQCGETSHPWIFTEGRKLQWAVYPLKGHSGVNRCNTISHSIQDQGVQEFELLLQQGVRVERLQRTSCWHGDWLLTEVPELG